MVLKTEKPKTQMQKYFIKPLTVDNKNPQQEKLQPPQQYSSSRNVDCQGSNLESQSYGHNDDIHIQRNLSPSDSVNNVENVYHNEANVSSSNDHYLSEMDIEEDLLKATGRKKTMSHKLMMNKVVMKTLRTSALKSVDVDKTFVVTFVVGKSISHEKLTLLDKQSCQPLKLVLWKKKMKIGKRD